jgi:predicted transcriptional regulator
MKSPTSADLIRPEAIALRRLGASRRQIKQILGVTNNETLSKALAGEPPPTWSGRSRAKEAERLEARRLRADGLTYREIAEKLGVSRSSVSLWVRDLPREGRLSYEQWRERSAAARRRYWEAERPRLEARREAVRASAAAEIGSLSSRELLIAGAVAYWCEGAKNKPYHRHDHVTFMNSDPGLVALFLRFLDVAGVSRDRLTFRISIHESADVDSAQHFWLGVTGGSASQFRKPTIKRHNPKTNRKNMGSGYHGCLRIDVLRGSELYRRIEGWVRAAAPGPDATPDA